MGDVTVGHDETITAYYGLAFRGSTAVNSNTLSQGCVVAYVSVCLLTFEFEILRDTRNYSTGEDAAIAADTRTIHDGYVVHDDRTVADNDVAFYD